LQVRAPRYFDYILTLLKYNQKAKNPKKTSFACFPFALPIKKHSFFIGKGAKQA
jgi:hypothetical protein